MAVSSYKLQGPAVHVCMCMHVCARVSPPGPYLLMEKILLAKLGSLLFSLLPVLGLPHHRGLFHRSDGHFLCKTRVMATHPLRCRAQPTWWQSTCLFRGHHTAECHLGTRRRAAFTGLGSTPGLLPALAGGVV